MKDQRIILRKPVVKERTGLSNRSIDQLEQDGKFPERVRLGTKSVGWYSDEVQEWIDTRERGSRKGLMDNVLAAKKQKATA